MFCILLKSNLCELYFSEIQSLWTVLYWNPISVHCILVSSEVSLIVPDFIISAFGSSCNSLIFGCILSYFLSLYISWHFIVTSELPLNRKKSKGKRTMQKRDNYCTITVVHKNCKIWDFWLGSSLFIIFYYYLYFTNIWFLFYIVFY